MSVKKKAGIIEPKKTTPTVPSSSKRIIVSANILEAVYPQRIAFRRNCSQLQLLLNCLEGNCAP